MKYQKSHSSWPCSGRILKDATLVFSCCPSCSEFYEPNALMMEEEGAIIAGLLVGLNVIDANFCMKGEDLDSQVLGVLLMFFPLI